ncbi:MAG: patatin-like phospholipase family protein [Xanthomonadales bacterium]|jgi:NTE family protein|nr:patatin-like phospholipase family protein [Xanthomonadales bacterium]
MKAIRLILAVLVTLPLFTLPAMAERDAGRPKIGLALSGGGARGSAHVGVLQALEDLDVPVDYIAGTSMGAIIGGMYAAGYRAAEIEEILLNMDWEGAMVDRPDRVDRTMRTKELESQFLIPFRMGLNKGRIELPLGLIEGQHLDQVFREILMPVVGIHDFHHLPIPFRAVATDLVTGEAVVLSTGSLPDSLRASMSVPGVFAPVSIEGRLLIDGGMANNLPVSVVREMGADIVIAVDISSPLLNRDQLTSVLSVTEQLTNFLTRRTTEAQILLLEPADRLIVPDLGNFSAADFKGAGSIVKVGYEAAMNPETNLAALSAGGHDRPAMPQSRISGFVVNFIELENSSVLNDEIILSRLAAEVGEVVNLKALDKSVDRIYSLDLFKSVTYDLVEKDGNTGIVVRALPREWGPNYLQFGLELSSDFSGSSDFKLGAAYTKNALNALGGELRVTASMGREDEISFDFYQPVDSRAKWFIEPEVFWSRENYGIWLEDTNIADLEFTGWGASFGVGRNFTTTSRLILNYSFARGTATVNTGNPDIIDDPNIDIGEMELQYIHDSLDSVWFPTSGQMHRLEYLYAAESLGASFDYRQAGANGALVLSHGRNTALLNYELGYSFDDDAPIERWYRLGGFGRLSGLVPNQLAGRHIGLATLAYYRRLNDLDLVSMYAGFTLEAGNTWNSRDAIGFDDLRYSGSLFVGADSPLGPAYVALGYGDTGDLAVYFYLGNPFRVSRFD